jgi:hypothetical protein
MSSVETRHPNYFPAVPPSLSAGDHGMREYYAAAQDTSRPAPYTVPTITPYLGLRARLSQVWINRWTILLFLILVRVLIAVGSLNHDLDTAKTEALAACSSVESMGSVMASMPHYMSKGVNDLAATGVEKAVRALMSMLLLTVTAVQELVVFFVNLLTSTYVCLITLVVGGSLEAALKVVEDVSDFLNTTLGDIGEGLQDGIKGFQDGLNGFVGKLNSIPQVFGGDDGTIPTLDVTSSLDRLNNLQLPSTLDQGLEKLNSSIPTFADVQKFTNDAIRLPFQEVKKLMNKTLGTYEFDRAAFPVPQKEKLTFCSDDNGISEFFDGLGDIVNVARRAFIGVLVVLAVLVCIPMAWREIQRWRAMRQRARLMGINAHDPLDVVYIASRPYTGGIGIKIATKIRSPRRQVLARWCVAYATSTPALLVLSIGLTGLAACLCQIILLKSIEKEVPALAGQVGEFSGRVVASLNNASEQWAIGTNKVITATNDDINEEVFGWVNTTTGAVNNTLNVFVDQTTKALNETFGGTILNDPIQDVFNCLIGLKIAGIQKGLTWVSDNARVDFPLFPPDTFAQGAAAAIDDDNETTTESFLASPGSAATDKVTGALFKVIDHIEESIRTEAIISTCVVLIWFVVVLMGLARASFLAFQHDKTRGEGGLASSRDIPLADPVQPYSAAAPAYEAHQSVHFPSFSSNLTGQTQSSAHVDALQDHKFGYAGQRGLPRAVHPGHTRSSSYGHVEKF